jgi:Na+-driven multidrug efflux pump
MTKPMMLLMLFSAFVVVGLVYLLIVYVTDSSFESGLALIAVAVGFILILLFLRDMLHPSTKQTQRTFTSTVRFCNQTLKINADLESPLNCCWCLL